MSNVFSFHFGKNGGGKNMHSLSTFLKEWFSFWVTKERKHFLTRKSIKFMTKISMSFF